jgi:hypothetical protein
MKSWFNRRAKSFDDVKEMVTRKLPVPDMGGDDKFVQFTARRDSEGYWTLSSKNNLKTVTQGVETLSQAFQKAIDKHLSCARAQTPNLRQKQSLMTFDSAFLILRDMEQSLLAFTGEAAKEEPANHYMAAWRLMPQRLQESLNAEAERRDAGADSALFPKNNPAIKPPPALN